MALFDTLGDLSSNVFDVFNARGREKQAKAEDEWRRKDLNFDPAYASEAAPQFQVASSPVARAYLESFLTGDNADAIQGTRLGADAQKDAAKKSFADRYGGIDALLARGKATREDPSRYGVEMSDRKPGQTRHEYAALGNTNDLQERRRKLGLE